MCRKQLIRKHRTRRPAGPASGVFLIGCPLRWPGSARFANKLFRKQPLSEWVCPCNDNHGFFQMSYLYFSTSITLEK